MTITSTPTVFDKWQVLDAIGWEPHRGQLLIAESTARHRVASCGRRFGNFGGCLSSFDKFATLRQTLGVSLCNDAVKRRAAFAKPKLYSVIAGIPTDRRTRLLHNVGNLGQRFPLGCQGSNAGHVFRLVCPPLAHNRHRAVIAPLGGCIGQQGGF